MTNGDRLRQMTDEELAEWLSHYTCDTCPMTDSCLGTYGAQGCEELTLTWLKQESEEQ